MNAACYLFEAAAACNHRPPQQTWLLTCRRLHPGCARPGRVCRPGFLETLQVIVLSRRVCACVCLYLHSGVCADRVQSPEGGLSRKAVNFLPGKKKTAHLEDLPNNSVSGDLISENRS